MMTAFCFGSEMSAFNAVNAFCHNDCGIDHVIHKMQTALNEVCEALERHRNKIGCEDGDYLIHNDLIIRRSNWERMIACAKRVDGHEANWLFKSMEIHFDLAA